MTQTAFGRIVTKSAHALSIAFVMTAVTAPAVQAQQTLVAPEKNPPGDIPDDQAFIDYKAPEGFSVKVPEGWARATVPNGLKFSDKYDVVLATVGHADAAPTAAAKPAIAADLAAQGHAARVDKVEEVRLKSGPALRITYLSNSDPNPVTGKPIRLEHERFLLFKDGKTVTLDFAAPAGADNVDQWKLMSNAFRWN